MDENMAENPATVTVPARGSPGGVDMVNIGEGVSLFPFTFPC